MFDLYIIKIAINASKFKTGAGIYITGKGK